MSVKITMRAVVEYSYDADPDHYQTDDPDQMVEIDKRNFDILPDVFLSEAEVLSVSFTANVKDDG